MNENNPPMMLPNGYVYGYNVSVEINDFLKSKIAVVTELPNKNKLLNFVRQTEASSLLAEHM